MISEKKRKAIVEALLEAGKPATKSDLKGFATKDSTLSREKRAKEGNWQGSLGRYVESHGAEINAAFDSHQLRNYVETTMKSALEPEAQAYLDELLASCQSERRLLQAVYNVALKGAGMGLHENKNNIKKFDYRKYIQDNWLLKESLVEDNEDGAVKNLNASESYPKAEAWLQQHPEIKVYTSVSDIADPSEFEDLETDLVEAGYMFISELEAALEGQNYGIENDEDLLASCEKGVINDPNYNPPVSSFNY